MCPEMKIKWLLDGCGNLWLEGKTKDSGILSRYKEMQVGNNEVTMSDLQNETTGHPEKDHELNDDAAETAGKEGRQDTPRSRFLKINELMQNGRLISVRVDTENNFLYNGKRYKISASDEQYHPKQTKVGVLYDADTVYVFLPKGEDKTEFLGQDLTLLEGTVMLIG